ALAPLNCHDRSLCKRFLDGEIRGPVRAELNSEITYPLDNANSAEALSLLRKLAPELIISVRYRCILKETAIEIPKAGVLNLHSGILPDYRGVMATFWAMLQGETEIGTTLHWIVDSGIDTGPIIAINRQATRPDASYLANVISLYRSGCDAIAEAVSDIAASNTLHAKKQHGKGRYFRAPAAADLHSFERNRLVLFDGSEHLALASGAE
ncbi:MAG: formyl transferase, partial [Gammaproteobacteria bacterium]|nr:formyl transferase [Gammaproteobacteria bacterium]